MESHKFCDIDENEVFNVLYFDDEEEYDVDTRITIKDIYDHEDVILWCRNKVCFCFASNGMMHFTSMKIDPLDTRIDKIVHDLISQDIPLYDVLEIVEIL